MNKLKNIIKESVDDYLNENKSFLSDYEIKPSTDNIYDVAEANGLTTKMEFNVIPIEKINYGGVTINNHQERKRLNNLKNQIQKNKFISRIIVDSNNNIIEGQHRYEAMLELGFDKIPIVKLFGVNDFIDEKSLNEFLNIYKIHPDHKNRLINMVAEIVADENGNLDELAYYNPPKGFEKIWRDIVNHLIKK